MAAALLLKEDALKNVCLPFVFEKKAKNYTLSLAMLSAIIYNSGSQKHAFLHVRKE